MLVGCGARRLWKNIPESGRSGQCMGQTSHGERRKGEHKDVNNITESTNLWPDSRVENIFKVHCSTVNYIVTQSALYQFLKCREKYKYASSTCKLI